jgi:glycosyltransferase involved in cell wall biosynthesis
MQREMPSRKVLLSAYSCAPHAGSEPAIGWNWAHSIAAGGHEVVVITRATNRASIQSLDQSPSSNPKFVFHDLPSLAQKMYKLPLGNYLYYLLWQYTAANRAVELHRSNKFDQVHHITWGSFRAPSFMGKLGIPFVFGPVGGGEDTPIKLREGMGWRGRLWDSLRRLSNSLLRIDPFTRSTYADATEILTTTPETLRKIPAAYRPKARVQSAAGINPDIHQNRSTRGVVRSFQEGGAILQVLYVGRLLPWKGIHLALRALARLGEKRSLVCLTAIGGGYDAPRLKRIARRLNLGASVKWMPWMPRKDLLRIVPDFDLFLFPSLHDSGGMVVLEALSVGLPVICLDLGGPSAFVDDGCGRIASTSGADENGVIEQIAAFLSEFLADPGKLMGLAENAQRRANSFTWEAHVRSVYGKSLVLQAD